MGRIAKELERAYREQMQPPPLLRMPPCLQETLTEVAQALSARRLTLALAESCTGGLVAACCTAISGSSAWFVGGAVAYANAVKVRQLGVAEATLMEHGAVSGPCVEQMASGVSAQLGADVGVAISGVAGPTGGTQARPVGTVWIAWAWPEDGLRQVQATHFHFPGTRDQVRDAAVLQALGGLLPLLHNHA